MVLIEIFDRGNSDHTVLAFAPEWESSLLWEKAQRNPLRKQYDGADWCGDWFKKALLFDTALAKCQLLQLHKNVSTWQRRRE